MPFLKVFTGGEERTVFLGDDPIVFGRGDDVDVLIKDVKISREHCVIEKDSKGRWRVLDLQSGNGTRVNGEEIQSCILEPEDIVEVGDTKVLFAAEAVSVVTKPTRAANVAALVEDGATEPRAPRRPQKASRTPILIGSIAVAGLLGLALLWQGGGRSSDKTSSTDPARIAANSGRSSSGNSSPVSGRQTGRTADDILNSLPRDLDVYGRALAAEKLLAEISDADRKAAVDAVRRAQGDVTKERDRFFGELESVFRKQVEEGRFARARELWFFLRGDTNWSPMPIVYRDRIIREMESMEQRASADRSKVLGEVSRAEDANDFEHAEELVREAMPRFAGTAVARSLEERLVEIDLARRGGVAADPTKPQTRVRADVRKRLKDLLAQLPERKFDAVATGVRALIAQAKDGRARAELTRRAVEVEAAAALQTKLAVSLAAGAFPKRQIQGRWRVAGGGAENLQVTIKGQTIQWPWNEVPVGLHLDLLARQVADVPNAQLGLAVIAHAIGGDKERAEAFALGYAEGKANPALDHFLAEVVKNEPLPEGGYVVYEGELLAKAEFVRQQEEELIARLRVQLDTAYASILADKSFKKVAKLTAKKNELDKRRAYALELIFDEKKYFYPYRQRSAEYYPVQKEVDHRVDAVRELWDDGASVRIAASDAVKRSLKEFDEAVVELNKRFVDTEEKEGEVWFLRSYFGRKLTIRTHFRDADELELLQYSAEVMEANVSVPGDISNIEREQVRVTNLYRMMFARWPVRIVEKLVLSSRGHCEEMSRIGYFGHFSPTPGRKTPYDRMRLAGYQYGASENIVAGTSDPKSAHQRWCHSSGHHRNLLMSAWTEMGTGHSGGFMCQNFGRAPKHSKIDAPTEPDTGMLPDDELPDDEGPSDPDKDKDPYDYESED